MRHETVGLIIVAAGSSRRMGGLDKIWAPLAGYPIVWHSLMNLSPLADRTALVVRPDQLPRAIEDLSGLVSGLRIVPGGPERQDSVERGLAAVGPVDFVAIHDAARPLAAAALLQAGLELLATFDGALPVTPLHDTIKCVDERDVVTATLDRSTLRAAQTPQVFRMDAIVSAHRRARSEGRSGTDDSSLLEAAGYRVKAYTGAAANFKITTPEDLRVARMLLEERP